MYNHNHVASKAIPQNILTRDNMAESFSGCRS